STRNAPFTSAPRAVRRRSSALGKLKRSLPTQAELTPGLDGDRRLAGRVPSTLVWPAMSLQPREDRSVPEVSVVVATRDRPHTVGSLLAALDAQALGRDRFEVILVDDGSAGNAIPEHAPRVDRLLRHERPLG